MDIGDLLSPAEAARELELTPASVRRLCNEGRLDHVRVSTGRLIPRDAVEELREARSSAALAAAAI